MEGRVSAMSLPFPNESFDLMICNKDYNFSLID
jgi:hypothetical protein